ncbi:hypothetical protein BGZ58_000752 [Dissophora ornata]|nr:hypothetical protein BGZ58_000752 [Dissophora ornata]
MSRVIAINRILREQIIQQLLSLDVNAASDSDEDGYNDYYDEDAEQEWYQPQDDQDDQDNQDNEQDGLEWYQPVAFPDDENEDAQHDGDDYQPSESATEYSLEDQPAEEETKKKKKKKKKKNMNLPLADDDQVEAQVSDLQVIGELYDP